MKKRWISLLLALVMVIGLFPAVLAAETVPTDFDWKVSKSKTATDLDADGSTRVTLSLPSAEETLTSDVVFVLDGSSSTDENVVVEALRLLEELKQAAKDNGATVNVCVVKFKRQAFKSDWYDLATGFDSIKAAMKSTYRGGTNIHAGLLAGKEAMEEHTNVSANRKYLVLISDGSTYLYSKDGKLYGLPTHVGARMATGQVIRRSPGRITRLESGTKLAASGTAGGMSQMPMMSMFPVLKKHPMLLHGRNI